MQLFGEIVRSKLKLLLGKGIKRSYSQFGEDAIVQNILKKKNGTYVDIGAYHPVLYSNTYAFYKRGWRGIAIDPNPRSKFLFRWFRPRDEFIHSAVGEKGIKKYYEYSDPAYNSFGSPTQHKNVKLIKESEVEVRPLTDLLPTDLEIDFMSIDVEGMDAEVLKTYHWKNRPRIIAVEGMLYDNSYEYLYEQGYILKGLAGPTMLFGIK